MYENKMTKGDYLLPMNSSRVSGAQTDVIM